MNRRWTWVFAILLLLGGNRAFGLIYLQENSLESLLVRGEVVAIAKVTAVSEQQNEGTIEVLDALNGEIKGTVRVSGVKLRLSSTELRVRFATGDRVILFLEPDSPSGRHILHSQKLDGDAEVKTMKGCVAEVMPHAATLADLANPKKTVDEKALRRALEALSASKNAYTQILVGRLMGSHLAEDYKPAAWQDVILKGLGSSRKELAHGAMVWAGNFEKLPDPVRAAVQKIAAGATDPALANEAKTLLEKKAP